MNNTLDIGHRAFIFIITLAAVINGLGLVRLLSAFAEYLRNQKHIEVVSYWVFDLWGLSQLLLHILLWWSLWNLHDAAVLNFGTYLYLLTGPAILYLGTSLLVPDLVDKRIDLRAHYFSVRAAFFTTMGLFWLWGLFSWPVLKGMIAPTTSIVAANFCIAMILRFTDNAKVHAALVIAVWAILIVFIAVFGMRLGGVG